MKKKGRRNVEKDIRIRPWKEVFAVRRVDEFIKFINENGLPNNALARLESAIEKIKTG